MGAYYVLATLFVNLAIFCFSVWFRLWILDPTKS